MTGHERVRFQLASLTEAMSSPGVVPHVTVSYDSSSVIQMGIAISDIVMKRTDTQGPYLAIRGMQGLAGERTVSGGMDGKEGLLLFGRQRRKDGAVTVDSWSQDFEIQWADG